MDGRGIASQDMIEYDGWHLQRHRQPLLVVASYLGTRANTFADSRLKAESLKESISKSRGLPPLT